MTYMAQNGSVNGLSDAVSLATADMDFSSEELTVRLEDGQQSAAIIIPILEVTSNLQQYYLLDIVGTLDLSVNG